MAVISIGFRFKPKMKAHSGPLQNKSEVDSGFRVQPWYYAPPHHHFYLEKGSLEMALTLRIELADNHTCTQSDILLFFSISSNAS